MTKKFPHTYVIIFYVLIAAALLTWFVPGGRYVKQEIVTSDGKTKLQTVYDTVEVNGKIKTFPKFEYIKSNKQTWQIITSFFDGFVKQSNIVIFILMIGGAFWIVNTSKAIDIGIFSFINFTKKLEKNKFLQKVGVNNIIIVLIMLMFSIFGAVFGMSEETIAFIVILVPLAISMGYDSIVGVAMVYFAASIGFAGAILNPFTIGIAQGIAGLPLFSGIEFRLFCWLVFNVVAIVFVLIYANKIKKNPSKSMVFETDSYWREHHSKNETEKVEYKTFQSTWFAYIILLIILGVFSYFFPQTELKIGNSVVKGAIIPIISAFYAITGFLSARKSFHFFNLNLLLYTIVFLIVGVMGYEWYVKEIAGLFMSMGLFAGIAAGYDASRIAKLFIEGAKDILSAALVVGLAGGIIVILQDGQIIDTILYALSSQMEGLGKIASVNFMYLITTVINVLIPSGSAKAAIIMPIMSPFADYISISRQAAVMAFQFGDGFTNLITPTSGVLIGVLEVAKIPFNKWIKWVAPIVIAFIVLGGLLLIPTVLMQLNGF